MTMMKSRIKAMTTSPRSRRSRRRRRPIETDVTHLTMLVCPSACKEASLWNRLLPSNIYFEKTKINTSVAPFIYSYIRTNFTLFFEWQNVPSCFSNTEIHKFLSTYPEHMNYAVEKPFHHLLLIDHHSGQTLTLTCCYRHWVVHRC